MKHFLCHFLFPVHKIKRQNNVFMPETGLTGTGSSMILSASNNLTKKRIAIVGREKQTVNYQKALDFFSLRYEVTLSTGNLSGFDALLLPGGGDIDPVLISEPDMGSKNIDRELDILQFQALDLFVKSKKPILGICKGFQLIELYFGASLIQDLPLPSLHPVQENGADSLHFVHCRPLSCARTEHSFSSPDFPEKVLVNSAHHQGIQKNGRQLYPFQEAEDGITEGVCHETLPILAFQWHPERMLLSEDRKLQQTGQLAFTFFLSLLSV